MKLLTLIIRASAQQDMADQLRLLEKVSGFTFSHVEGHGTQVEGDALLSVRDKVVGYTPRVRVDILLQDAHVDLVLGAVRDATYGAKDQGVFWVTGVEKSGRL